MAPRVYACLYIRKSNVALEQKSLKDQIAEGRAYCKDKGWILREEHLYIDEETAYRKPAEKRKGFMSMVNMACTKKPPFSKVVVWKIDRFSRRAQDSFKYYQMLDDNNVELHSMTQTFGDGAGGRMNLGIHIMMAQFFSDNQSEDVTRGMRSSALKGYWTNANVPFGYETYCVEGKNKKLRIEEEDAEIVREIFDLAVKGWGCKRIGAKFNFRKMHIWNILTNEHYTGDRVIKDKTKTKVMLRVPNTHPVIVDKKIFEKAQRSLKSRSKGKNARGVGNSLYAGILKCSCGYVMHRTRHGSQEKYAYYRCSGKHTGSGCIVGNVKEDRITDLIVDLLKDKIFSANAIKQMFALAEKKRKDGDLEKATRHLNRELAENKVKQRRLIELVRDGYVPMEDIKEDMEQLKSAADDLEAKLDFSPEEPIKPQLLKKLLQGLKRDLLSDSAKKHDAMRELVKEIVVDLPKIRVTTSLMAVEDKYEIYYYTPPSVPENYQALSVLKKRVIAASIRKFRCDSRKNIINHHDCRIPAKPIKQYSNKQLDAYIKEYLILRNDVRSLGQTTKTEKDQPRKSKAA